MTGQIDKEAVGALLTGERVLGHFGVDGRGSRTITLRECPRCRRTPRRLAVRVNRDTGLWQHHGGGETCKGDKYDLLAAFMGLDARRDFPRVLELAAQLTGISPDTDHTELARILEEHRARTAARDQRAAAERAEGEAMVPAMWNELTSRHPRGEAYLAGRGIDPAALRGRGDVVRYYRDGSPAVRLRSFETGAPINIVRRCLDGEPKVLTLDLERVLGLERATGSFSTAGSLIGWPGDVADDGVDVAVIAEGLTDSLVACLAFPWCAVLGANGASRMADVARAAAPRLVEARGWLLVAVDDDSDGVAGATVALRAGAAAGLEIERSVRAFDVAPHKDLADAWRAGWRWQWAIRGAA